MILTARLHLPAGPRDLAVEPGEAVEVDTPTVAHLQRRVDARDRIHLGGRRIDRRDTAGRVRAGLGLVTAAAVAPDVAVLDHLAAITPVRRAHALLASSPLLADRGTDLAGVLSGGERRVLALLRAAATEPTVVVLDGAAEGLDPTALGWAGEQVARWRAAGVAILVRPGRPEERAWLG